MNSKEKAQVLKLKRNEYFRNWRKNNPEKVKAINERFYAKAYEKQQKENQNIN